METTQKVFLDNLAVTQKYITKYKLSENQTTDLRTLNFKIDNEYIFKFEKYDASYNQESFITTKWINNPINEKTTILNIFDKQIHLKREALVGDYEVEVSGRILISNYYDALWEGYCEIVTEGFADEHDLLPIDTWFHLENGLLYSWIPEEYIEIASDCIWASSTDIFKWHEKEISDFFKVKEKPLVKEIKIEKKEPVKKVSILKKWFGKN
ncbi:hypothetical protein QVZ41_13855 [Wenyingzhuangia sp. chi5]|uniref:CYTH domain-containing protein n=1 Tax=Wenyingzhuangia gilva TaxID=3057677 RepID=A0ABT8VVC9_9FLAO|nr:hypothetical protein [Wenyingzhuangia sp. chi5]MDO3695931.1 hypothetical protein [Wenyingzhuangia sp. chi5]